MCWKLVPISNIHYSLTQSSIREDPNFILSFVIIDFYCFKKVQTDSHFNKVPMKVSFQWIRSFLGVFPTQYVQLHDDFSHWGHLYTRTSGEILCSQAPPTRKSHGPRLEIGKAGEFVLPFQLTYSEDFVGVVYDWSCIMRRSLIPLKILSETWLACLGNRCYHNVLLFLSPLV